MAQKGMLPTPCLINRSIPHSPNPCTYRLHHDVELRRAVALEEEEQHKDQARPEEGDKRGWSWSMHGDESTFGSSRCSLTKICPVKGL